MRTEQIASDAITLFIQYRDAGYSESLARDMAVRDVLYEYRLSSERERTAANDGVEA